MPPHPNPMFKKRRILPFLMLFKTTHDTGIATLRSHSRIPFTLTHSPFFILFKTPRTGIASGASSYISNKCFVRSRYTMVSLLISVEWGENFVKCNGRLVPSKKYSKISIPGIDLSQIRATHCTARKLVINNNELLNFPVSACDAVGGGQ